MKLSSSFCRAQHCHEFQKRGMNNNYECRITGKLPGNMITCPLDTRGKN